ncbi:MAG: hypothetical protein K6T83_02865 [Alicyclobacillus sp.]|nr:hypothetical protein [Alicyclobacillus sp.]
MAHVVERVPCHTASLLMVGGAALLRGLGIEPSCYGIERELLKAARQRLGMVGKPDR